MGEMDGKAMELVFPVQSAFGSQPSELVSKCAESIVEAAMYKLKWLQRWQLAWGMTSLKNMLRFNHRCRLQDGKSRSDIENGTSKSL